MKLTKRPALSRALTKTDWLSSYHSFSFGGHTVDDAYGGGYKTLRVINEDFIAPSSGFETHPHQDVEILTYMLDGTLTHGDSTGNNETLSAGEVQLMSAGAGIQHSEHNHDPSQPVHMLQIWVRPADKGGEPSYKTLSVPMADKKNTLKLIASMSGEAALQIGQDVNIYTSYLTPGNGIEVSVDSSRSVYAHMAMGSAIINEEPVELGDGLIIEETDHLSIQASETAAEILLFDLA